MEVIKQRIMKKLFYLIAALLLLFAGYSQTAQEYFDRGITKFNLENFAEAIVDFTKAIEIDPKYAIAYVFRGRLKITLGQKESACLDFRKAGELGRADAWEDIKKYCQ